MTYTTEELEAVPHYDGPACVCAWCSDSVAAVMVRDEPICVDCRTIAYERALLQKIAALTQERDRLREALKPFSRFLDKETCTVTVTWSDGSYQSTYTGILRPADFFEAHAALGEGGE